MSTVSKRPSAIGALIAVACALLATGCHNSRSSSSPPLPSGIHTPFVDPTPRLLTTAEPMTTSPAGLAPQPSLDAVRAASLLGPGRLAAEQFAVLTYQVLIDVRRGWPGEEVVGLVAGGRLPTALRDYLVTDITLQQQIGTQRAVDTAQDLWIRSHQVRPGRFVVEVAAVTYSKPLDISHWYRLGFEVTWANARWFLTDYRGASSEPPGTSGLAPKPPLTPQQRLRVLPGPGWRLVQPRSP